jgi:hypothetical protein
VAIDFSLPLVAGVTWIAPFGRNIKPESRGDYIHEGIADSA